MPVPTARDPVREFAPAKLNLFLHVLGRRADGFHDLQSLVAFADAGDELAFAPADGLSLAVGGRFAAGLEGESDNLVLRAARALAVDAGVDALAQIVLTKNLPVASGIGGGSADAAAALRGLRRLWNLAVPDTNLKRIATSLGSDIPVCVASGTAFMKGRGETLTALPPLPALALVLVNPGVSVATRDVFAGWARAGGKGRPAIAAPPKFADSAALIAYLESTGNDLEAPARVVAPVIGEVLDALVETGAAFVRMSGSGATCFGLYERDADAVRAAAALSASHRDWWAVPSRLREGP
jgi:4-diphosphocytidyl-2-C-methyl-D-erythritol kinase